MRHASSRRCETSALRRCARWFVRETRGRDDVFALRDTWSLFGLTSKIPPLDSMLNFDADVNKTTTRHQCENYQTR